MHPDQLDGELMLAPGFATPPNMDYSGYHNYITDNLPPESPLLYGLHPNAEIGFLTASSEKLFKTVFELQPREGLLKHYWDLVYFFTYFLLVYKYTIVCLHLFRWWWGKCIHLKRRQNKIHCR